MFDITDASKSTEEIAQQLLGHLLVKETDSGVMSGWIVETEAYLGYEDAAAHSYLGKRTPRLHSMYQKAGTVYIYQMHTHKMLNIVTQPEGVAHAVLIRAVEPNEGEKLMQLNRKKNGVDLTNGPGKLTKALNISMEDNGLSIFEKPLYLDLSKKLEPIHIEASPRIGIPNKGEWTEANLRYTVSGNPYLSKKRGKVSMDNGWKTMLE
ncbi:DNA-3-methyladenine glycosylase [Marinilactibacillus sp. 15R]|uniref:DNA-3-methyladenine glycosylase n=1 Tax=Marinilactibacillus sp. 15R TaxID=1911586 RepID=UPI000934B18F|nr:DNA-3-methyladenine glycosylase [Marinilactibacillus sp. 15R]